MKSHRSTSFFGSLALFLLLATILSGEEATEANDAVLDNPVGSIPVPAEIDRKTAMNTCVNAAIGREWRIISKKDNIIRINLKHRSWDATVYFVVNDDVILMYSDSYTVNKKTGEKKKKKDPEGWLKNLRKDIGKAFDKIIFVE